MGKLRYNVFETLVYLSPVTGTILLVLSLAAEWEGLVAPGGGFSKIAASPGLYATATVMSFLVNMFTYLAIMHSSRIFDCFQLLVLFLAGTNPGREA